MTRSGASEAAPERRSGSPAPAWTPLRMEEPFEPVPGRVYSMHDLLAYHDEAFVTAAYRVLLGRFPDPAGFTGFVTRLRAGALDRMDILEALARSEEGRRLRGKVVGLAPRLLLRRLGRIPLAGGVVRAAVALAGLSRERRGRAAAEAVARGREERLCAGLNALGTFHGRLEDEVRGLADALAVGASRGEARAASLRAGLEALRVELRAAALRERERVGALEGELEALSERVRALEAGPVLDGALYQAFEERFRGPREEVQKKLAVHLPLLAACGAGRPGRPVLDVGCGRGDWLALLRDAGLEARGVDASPEALAECPPGLDVACAEGVRALRALPAGSLGAVTAFHVVEHLTLETLLALLRESGRALAPGGLALFETPDPENLLVGACHFYADPTHRRPIPAPTLQFLAERCGFARTEIRRLNPFEAAPAPGAGEEPFAREIANRLYGPRDYALVAWKDG